MNNLDEDKSISENEKKIIVDLNSFGETLNSIFKEMYLISDEEIRKEKLKEFLFEISNHVALFLSVLALDVLLDPENWIKSVFQNSLNNIKRLRKDSMESFSDIPENQTP